MRDEDFSQNEDVNAEISQDDMEYLETLDHKLSEKKLTFVKTLMGSQKSSLQTGQ